MGICTQHNSSKDGPAMKLNRDDVNLRTGFVWVVMKRDINDGECTDKDGNTRFRHHIQGIFEDHIKAEAICQDENYYIGPLPVNSALPEKVIEWVGAYWPLRK